MMRRQVLLAVFLGSATALAIACTINPQPLPPESFGDSDAGTKADGSTNPGTSGSSGGGGSSSGSSGTSSGGFGDDAGQASDSGASDAQPPPIDAGTDASDGSSDGSTDAPDDGG
jgi:hypothetical protein